MRYIVKYDIVLDRRACFLRELYILPHNKIDTHEYVTLEKKNKNTRIQTRTLAHSVYVSKLPIWNRHTLQYITYAYYTTTILSFTLHTQTNRRYDHSRKHHHK